MTAPRPVDIEDQEQHVGHNGNGQVRLEVQSNNWLPHHQFPKFSIEGLHTTSTASEMQPQQRDRLQPMR